MRSSLSAYARFWPLRKGKRRSPFTPEVLRDRIIDPPLEIGGQSQSLDLAADAMDASFRVKSDNGPTQLQTTFSNAEGKPLPGAYYVYVQRLAGLEAGSFSKG